MQRHQIFLIKFKKMKEKKLKFRDLVEDLVRIYSILKCEEKNKKCREFIT